MLDFIYDSLDTVKKLKFPTVKQIIQLTASIFVLVTIAGAYFILADTIFSGGYKAFYSAMMDGKTPSVATSNASQQPSTTGEATIPMPPLEIPAETGTAQ